MKIAFFKSNFFNHAVLLFIREARYRITSLWFYFVSSIICFISWIYGAGFQQTFLSESVLVTVDPLMALDILVIIFMGVVLGLRLAAGMAWEREHRTLEILIVGPVSWGSIIFAKFLVEICIMFLLIMAYLVYLLLSQPLGSGVLEFADTFGVIQMCVFALPTLALGLMVGAWARTVRAAVVTFFIVMGLLVIFELLLIYLENRSIDQISLSELFLRSSLDSVAPFIEYISAAGQLTFLVKVLKQDISLSSLATAWAGGLTLLSLIFATTLARLRGVS